MVLPHIKALTLRQLMILPHIKADHGLLSYLGPHIVRKLMVLPPAHGSPSNHIKADHGFP